ICRRWGCLPGPGQVSYGYHGRREYPAEDCSARSADSVGRQSAAVAEDIEGIAVGHDIATDPAPVDPHAADEMTIDLRQRMQIALEVSHRHIVTERAGSREVTQSQVVILPDHLIGVVAQGDDVALVVDVIDIAEALGQTMIA